MTALAWAVGLMAGVGAGHRAATSWSADGTTAAVLGLAVAATAAFILQRGLRRARPVWRVQSTRRLVLLAAAFCLLAESVSLVLFPARHPELAPAARAALLLCEILPLALIGFLTAVALAPGPAAQPPEGRMERLVAPLLVSLALLFSGVFSHLAPNGSWTNSVLGVELWMESDPGGHYLPGAHQLFAAPGELLFAGHPGLPLQIALQIEQGALYGLAGGVATGLSFSEWVVRHLAEVIVAAKLTSTVLHLVSFWLLFRVARVLGLGRPWAAAATLIYATSFPVLFFLSRVSVEPWLQIAFLLTVEACLRFREAERRGARNRALWTAAGGGAAAMAGFFTKMHLLGPLPLYALAWIVLGPAHGKRDGRLRAAAAAAYSLAGTATYLAFARLMDWSSFRQVWLIGEPGTTAAAAGLAHKAFEIVGAVVEAVGALSVRALLPGTDAGGLFFLLEAPFVILMAAGLAAAVWTGGAGRWQALWLAGFCLFNIAIWLYRARGTDFHGFHYLFIVYAVGSIYGARLLSRLAERSTGSRRWRVSWRMAVAAILLAHLPAAASVAASRWRDVEEFRASPTLRLYDTLARLGPGDQAVLAGAVNLGFDIGLFEIWARDGQSSRLLEEIRGRFYVVPGTDPEAVARFAEQQRAAEVVFFD